MGKRSLFVLLAVSAVFLTAMVWHAPNKAKPRESKLQFQVSMQEVGKVLDLLTDDDKKSLDDNGFTYTQDEIVSHPLPAAGVWLKIGEDFIPVDEDGSFEIPEKYADESTAQVYPQLADEEPAAEISLKDQPLLYTIKGKLGSSMEMDGKEEDDHGEIKRVHGPQVPSKCDFMKCDVKDTTKKGCCQDFDGPYASDPKIRLKGTAGGNSDIECNYHRYKAFLRSICSIWVAKGPCAGEAAFKGKLEDKPGLPGCYAMHRGRWCQHLDPDDCDVTAAGGGSTFKVKAGGKIKIEVVNNTPANSTGIRIGKIIVGGIGGKIELVDTKKGSLVSMGSDLYRLDHYIDKANPTNDAVYSKKLVIEYEAPSSLPDDADEATEKVSFSFWGKTITIEIEITK